MVLHHVAQSAGVVVEGAALFHSQVFGDGDLDVGDVLAPPQGLEQRIAKPHGKQVLHRRLAQVMVDAEHLPFGQHLPHRLVDGPVGGQVMAQGFFQHHAHVQAIEPHRRDLLHDAREQAGGGGQVHHHRICVTGAQKRGQFGVVVRPGQVHGQEVQHGRKPLELLRAGPLGALHGIEARVDQCAVLVVVQRVTAHANDAPPFRQAAVAEGLEQGGHQLAPGQVAGASKQDKVKTHGCSRQAVDVCCECNLVSWVVVACGSLPMDVFLRRSKSGAVGVSVILQAVRRAALIPFLS